MTLLETALSSINIYTAGGTILARASEVNVSQPLTTEIYSALLQVDHEWASNLESGGKTIEIGNTIDVYLGRDVGSMLKVFSGRIWDLEKEIDGHIPRWYNLDAKGWGDYLQSNYNGYRRTVDTIDNVIQWIIQPLIDNGSITVGTIFPSTTTITWDHLGEDITMFDGVVEVCRDNDWEMYVNNDKEFYAFPKGSIETSETFSNIVHLANWKSSGKDIINAQRVIGQMTNQVGSDALYTESATNWSTDGAGVEAIRTTIGVDWIGVPDNTTGAGTFGIRAYKADASGGIYMRYTFGAAIDLYMHGNLHLSTYYSFFGPLAVQSVAGALTLEIRLETDSSNYFEYILRFSGAKSKSGFLMPSVPKWEFGWHEIDIPFNMRAGYDRPAIVGTPTWTSIASIKITVTEPLAAAGDWSEAELIIDNLYFDKGFYYSFRQDSTSIAKYDERRGPLVYRPKFTSNAVCEELADRIIETYKNPINRFTSLNLVDLPSTAVNPGEQATITVSEITNVSMIQSIDYNLKEYDLHVDVSLASVFYPSLDEILSEFKKFMDDATQVSLPETVVPSAILGIARGPLGIKDIDIAHTQDNLVLNGQFEVDSDYDNIPDKWYGSDETQIYRTSVEQRTGQYSGYVTAGKTLYSEYFPIDMTGGYWYRLYARGTHDGSQSTLSAYIEYAGVYPTLSSTGSIAICENVSPQGWTRYSYLEPASSIPGATYWGRVKLVGDSGTVSYFDDINVQRLMGIDTGMIPFVRPLEYSTASESPVLVYSETWDVQSMDIKYVVTKVATELKTGNVAHAANADIIFSFGGVAKDTFHWSQGNDSYNKFTFNGSIDGGEFGQILVVDYYLYTADAVTTAFMRNMETWINTYSLKERMLDPFGTDPLGE